VNISICAAALATVAGLAALMPGVFARERVLDEGGRQIVIATDRRIGMREAHEQPRTIDYPFTLIEIRLGSDGRGEGKMTPATKIALNTKTNTVELENYASEPVRLQNVKVEKS
jgi:hypothetical protein